MKRPWDDEATRRRMIDENRAWPREQPNYAVNHLGDTVEMIGNTAAEALGAAHYVADKTEGTIAAMERRFDRLLRQLGEDPTAWRLAAVGLDAADAAKEAIDTAIWSQPPPPPPAPRQAVLPLGGRQRRAFWSDLQVSILRGMLEAGDPPAKIATVLHRPESAVYTKARALGFRAGGPAFRADRGTQKPRMVKWTEDEERALRRAVDLGCRDAAALARRFGDVRSAKSYYGKAREMGLLNVTYPKKGAGR